MMEDFDPAVVAFDKELEEVPKEHEKVSVHDDVDEAEKDAHLDGREDEGIEDHVDDRLEESKSVESQRKGRIFVKRPRPCNIF